MDGYDAVTFGVSGDEVLGGPSDLDAAIADCFGRSGYPVSRVGFHVTDQGWFGGSIYGYYRMNVRCGDNINGIALNMIHNLTHESILQNANIVSDKSETECYSDQNAQQPPVLDVGNLATVTVHTGDGNGGGVSPGIVPQDQDYGYSSGSSNIALYALAAVVLLVALKK
jgi:hypothetical protein